MKYKVSVEKRLYTTGIVEVEASTADEAIELVEEQIAKGYLQTTAVKWDDPTYEDDSFVTTGDVD